MKKWFAKFRISAALDEGGQLSPSLRQRHAESEDVARFAADCRALERGLKESLPEAEAPPFLHAAIMRAVRAAEQPTQERQPGLGFLRLAPAASVCLALVLAGVWLVWHQPPTEPREPVAQALAMPGAALQWSGEMTRSVPSVVVNPLTKELWRLNRDLDKAAEFLMASLP